MSDLITLTGIEGRGFHGVLEHEKRVGQRFSADVVVAADHGVAGLTDDLADTVDYGFLAEEVHALITGEPFELIEALAEAIAARSLEIAGAHAQSVTVTVHKPQAPISVPFRNASVTVTRARRPFVLALGSNLGDSGETLRDAVRLLREARRVEVQAVSDAARTAPVGGPEGQPDYLNLVVTGETTLSPRALLALAQRVEQAHGRTREVRWGARTLDVDVIRLGDLRSDDPVLTLPHPRAAQRAFVLAPWSWADPGAVLDGRLVSELAAEAPDADGVERLGPLDSLDSPAGWDAGGPAGSPAAGAGAEPGADGGAGPCGAVSP